MQIPLPGTYSVIQKNRKFSVTRCFFGHFKVESRVTSVARASAIPLSFFLILLFQTSLLDWICWKIKVKRCAKPPKWVPEGTKKAKKALCSSGIKGKPDDFFPIPVTPIKIENHEDFVSTTFSYDVLYLEQAQ
jgi:hypothetical protein